jgi:HicB family
MTPSSEKRKLTLRLSPDTIRKAQVLAERRSVSLNDFLAQQLEDLIRNHEAYEMAQRSALSLMRTGFHLGGSSHVKRDELHTRSL